MRNYIKYFLVLFVFFVLIIFIENSHQYAKSAVRNLSDYVLVYLVHITGWFFWGLFLGGINLIYEVKKIGTWKVNKEKLLILGIPLFLVLILHGIAYLEVAMPRPIEAFLFFIVPRSLVKYIATFLGYIAISSFTKQ